MDISALNPAQAAAVTHGEGPLLVIAGAGSGKTRVLTHRIAHLVDQGIAPYRILALTFTNKSAEEMRERAARLLGGDLGGLWAMTFHAACLRLLRPYAERLGYPPRLSVIDADDQRRVMRAVISAGGIEHLTERAALERISSAKNQVITPTGLAAQASDEDEAVIAALYGAYQQRLRAAGVMDFDDLLMCTVLLAEGDAEVRADWQSRFTHVLVDEYQDTNHAQYRLLRALAAPEHNICAVGDPNQSIYAFRGADIANIEDFTRDFPGARVVALEENYRSHQAILDLANRLITHNATTHGVQLRSDRPAGPAPRMIVCRDDRDEARHTARWAHRMIDIGVVPTEIAILYRTNAQSRVMEDALRAAGVAYRVVGGMSFYERAEIRDAIAYARLAVNERDALALTRAAGAPKRGIGPKALAALAQSARAHAGNLRAALGAAESLPGVSAPARRALVALGALVSEVAEQCEVPGQTAWCIERLITASNLIGALRTEGTLEAQGRVENLEQLIAAGAEHDRIQGTLVSWLETVALQTSVRDEGGARISLMTLHSAKGLEFDHVALVGLEEGMLPHGRDDAVESINEERRLCYVGITRARKELVLSAAERRVIHGGPPQERSLSRFCIEMGLRPAEDITPRRRGAGEGSRRRAGAGPAARRPESRSPHSPDGPRPARPTPLVAPIGALAAGDRVQHASFGIGQVVGVDAAQVRVRFADGSVRTLLIGIAPLTRIP